jgi:3-oxoacyl-[acyl-carrier-protein] synthase-3
MVQGELALPACDVASASGVCVAGMTALRYAVNAVRSGDSVCAVATGSELSSASMRAENFAAEIDSQVDALREAAGVGV